MTRTSFLVGISALAFAAGTANAQTTTTDSANNTRTVNCAAGDPANTCTVNNGTTTNAANANNTGTASALGGVGNTATVTQIGNNNSASVGITGSANSGLVSQGVASALVNNNVGQVQSTGTNNRGRIEQGDGFGGLLRTGGNNNSASIMQNGNGSGVGGGIVNDTLIYQAQSGNSATASQTRTAGATTAQGANTLQIVQAYSTAGAGGINNVANTTQNGTNLFSDTRQDDQNNTGFAASNNRAVVSQSGLGSTSTVAQYSRGNSATVTLGGGGLNVSTANSARNVSDLTQQNNRILVSGGVPSANAAVGTTTSNNQANVAIIGLQNSSTINQNGINNSATISMLGGGVGNTSTNAPAGFPNPRREGNTSNLTQTGRGNFYAISAGGSTSTNPNGGRGSLATVTQGDGTVATSDLSNAVNMRATVYQRGTADTVTIIQNNNFNPADGVTVQSGSSVDVSQLSTVGSVSITQTGTNSASVTQGLNADNSGGFQTLTLNQTDQGSSTTPSADPFGSGGSTVTANVFSGAQYGTNNVAQVTQNTIAGSSTLFQSRLSSNNLGVVTQGTGDANSQIGIYFGGAAPTAGTGANSRNLASSITQTGVGGTARTRQDGSNSVAAINQSGDDTVSGNITRIYQASTFNSATSTQSGSGNFSTIGQVGVGTSAKRNLATMTQSGTSNSASILQSASSGASATGAPASGPTPANTTLYPNARAAGAASVEAVIIQSQRGNSASITQNGLGQYASITQNGILNSGTITQDAAATNAVAILEQNGNGNTYTIAQGAGDAGAYIRVQQTGNQNASTGTTTFGTGATGAGTGPGAPNAGPF